MDGDLFVLYVDTGADESDENQRTLADNIRFAESVGAKVVKSRGQGRRGKGCGIRARESRYAGGLRSVGHERVEEIFLSFRDSQVPARYAGGGCAHRDPGNAVSGIDER